MTDKFAISFPAALKWLAVFLVAQWVLIPSTVRTLVILMAVDYAFGVATAFVRKKVSSAIGFRGLIRKMMVLALLLVIHVAEQQAGIELHIEQFGAMGYCVNELISIVENCAKAGIPIPAQLVTALLTVKHLRMQGATAEQLAELDGEQAKG